MTKADKIVSLDDLEIATVSGGTEAVYALGASATNITPDWIWDSEWWRRLTDHPGDDLPVNP